MNNKLLIIITLLCSNCSSTQHNNSENMQKTYPEECSKLYCFNNELIDLELMQSVPIGGLPNDNFKTCSKYAHRFAETSGDTVIIKGKTFVVVNNNKTNTYQLQITEKQKLIKTIQLPVADPLSEVHEYRINLLPYLDEVIVLMSDWYATHYRLVKYDLEGKELLRNDIEHTYITHPKPNTNHHNRYLYYYGITNSQIIFTSHMAFADKFKTILLNLNDFSSKEYDKIAHGIILDENDKELAGFVTANEDYENEITNYHITMLDGSAYDFTLRYGMPTCNFLLKNNLLYIANYHPSATGSALHCFDLKTRELKWSADVLQVNADHSRYWNKVTLSLYKNKLLMEGNEAYGNYLQIFDCETGKRLAHF